MKRPVFAGSVLPGVAMLVIGAALLVLGICLAVFRNVLTMPSYLAGWLFLSAIPFGALPLVAGIELAHLTQPYFAWTRPLAGVLRRQLLLAPLALLLAIPMLLRMHELYLHSPLPHTPFSRFWMIVIFYRARVSAYLVLWTLLCIVFAAAPPVGRPQSRRGLAAFTLMLCLIMGTFFATDLVMAVEPGWGTSDFGVLFMISQCVIALSCAILRTGAMARAAAGPRTDLTRVDRAWTRLALAELHGAGIMLLGLTGVWIFVQYTQFEAIWSADLPSEIIWYIHRDAGSGHIVEWVGFVGGLILPAMLLPSRRPGAAPVSAMVLLLVQALDMLWLITPAFRIKFTIIGIDAVEMLGMIGIGFGILLLLDLMPFREPALPAPALRHPRPADAREAGIP